MNKLIQTIAFCFIFTSFVFGQSSQITEILELNSATFKEKVWNFDKNKTFVREGKLPIILDFHATWCRPCKMLAPHLRAIQNKYKGKLIIYKIDVDKNQEIARRFNVEAMPTIVFIGSKTAYVSEVGYREYKEFDGLVKKHFGIK